MKKLVKDIKTFALDVLFPVECLFCQKRDVILCSDCMREFIQPIHQICIVCKKQSLLGVTHPACSSPWTPDGLLCMFDYHDERVKQSIVYGKYRFVPRIYAELGKFLGQWIIERGLRNYFQNFHLIPLPLAKSRKRWRGFNQAEIISQGLSESVGLPISHALARTKRTKTQKDLNKEARQKNVENAFGLISKQKNPWYRHFITLPFDNVNSGIKNKNIILIDDVATTGSTLLEAAKALKRNGAGTVYCITIARD